MAQEEVKFTIADNESSTMPNNGIQVDLILTYDPSMKNADGSYTVTAASGTYAKLTPAGVVDHTDTITGLVQPKSSLIVDNELFVVSDPATSPIVTHEGIAFSISNTADSTDGTGVITLNDENGGEPGVPPTDTPQYGLVNSGNGNPVMNFTEAPVCFVTGTAIRTVRGDVAVERLAVGDRAVTAAGEERAIVWIGHRELTCGDDDRKLFPIRVAANAFGGDLPARDLFLSPGHPVLVGADEDGRGGHLVPIMCLVNGTTIERVPVETITYWHVELETHDILLAENLPAESYLDWGDRVFFTDAVDHALVNPDHVVPGLAGRCRPVALDGPVVEAERRRLDALFATRTMTACAWPETADTLTFFG